MNIKIIRPHKAQKSDIRYRLARLDDALCLSILLQQVYIHTYATEGVEPHLTKFMCNMFAVDTIRQKIEGNDYQYILATYGDNLVGAAEISYKASSPIGDLQGPELGKLYVFEHFIGLGIGYQLINQVEEHLLAKGYHKLWLWVYAYNDRAIAFYERQQYEHLGNAFLEIGGINYENKVLYKQLC